VSGDVDIAPLDPRAYAVLAEAGLGPDLFNPRQHRCCELVERYARELGIDLCARLGVLDLLAEPHTVASVRDARGFVPSFDRALRWLLEHARHAGVLVRDRRDGADAYRLAGPPRVAAPEALRAAGLAADPSYAPAYELLDVAAELYPRVARGEVQAERALFLRIGLWASYFDNANGYYALNNRVAARAAASRLRAGTVLEVGAGLGSATEALCEELRARGRLSALVRYQVTEPVVFFRRRAQRMLDAAWPHVPLVFDALDLNQPWGAQGIAPGSCALVWGVNVFHLARSLEDVLRAVHDALAPGGWLVVGEGVRPSPAEPVGAELPFQLLDGFHDVRLDPITRPTAGFLTAGAWDGALRRAGFAAVEAVPDVPRLQRFQPGLVTAAFCARRA
jgi:SAM-dependent methyltransferase